MASRLKIYIEHALPYARTGIERTDQIGNWRPSMRDDWEMSSRFNKRR
jgi:hypothetical protein